MGLTKEELINRKRFLGGWIQDKLRDVENSKNEIAEIDRQLGVDRATELAIEHAISSPPHVFVSTGLNFQDQALMTMVGQFGQSNNLTLARIMIGAIPKEQYEQGDITGSNRGISVFIEFEGEPKRITITDVADEIPQDKSPREGRPMV